MSYTDLLSHRFWHRFVVHLGVDLRLILGGFGRSKSVILGVDFCMIFACRPKSGPRAPQEQPRVAQGRPQSAQESPKGSPRAAQERPKGGQERLQSDQLLPKSRLGSFLDAFLARVGDPNLVWMRSCHFRSASRCLRRAGCRTRRCDKAASAVRPLQYSPKPSQMFPKIPLQISCLTG